MKGIGKLFALVLGLLAIVLFSVGLATQGIGTLAWATFCAWGMALLGAISSREKNVIYIFFLFTFFIFLLSRVMVRWMRTGEIYRPFSVETMIMVYGCLTVSLFGLAVGNATSGTRVGFGRKNQGQFIDSEERYYGREDNINLPLIRQISSIVTVICGFATLFVVIERITFWRISGYGGDLRTSFSSTLPDIILRFSYVYVMMFCIYLASLPERKKCIPIIIQYLVVSALRMFYGSRVDFVIGLMFIFVYFMIRDRLNEEQSSGETKWVGRSLAIFAIVSIPVLVVLMVFVDGYRSHQNFEFSSFFETLGDFFESQGTSINVIGYTDIYKEQCTQPKFLYLFDRTYEFLTANPISSIITGRHAYRANTVERAQYGTSLGMTLYYHINQVSYLAGNGCGSSYVAEGWLGYGYFGLFIINVILSRIISRLNEFEFKRFVPSVIWLIFLQSLFFMPRNNFDAFVDDIASITNVFAIFALWVLYKFVQQRHARWP